MKFYQIAARIALLVFPLWTAMGQGRSAFEFENGHVAAGVNAPIFDSDGVALDMRYFAELWGAATPDSLVPAVNLDNGTRLILPFVGGGYFQSGVGRLAVPSLFNGGFSWLQVRAWDADLGPTYEEAAAKGIGGYGESLLFYADGAHPFNAPLPEIPGPLIGLESFSLRPLVPEPSTWALLALGGVTIAWIARRRQRKSWLPGTQQCRDPASESPQMIRRLT